MKNNKRNFLIVGAGGHAKVLAEIILSNGYKLHGFISPNGKGKVIYLNYKIICNDDEAIKLDRRKFQFVNGIGLMPKSNLRKKINQFYEKANITFEKLQHYSAVVSNDCQLSEGVQILAGATIRPGVRIGKGSIINTSSSIDHDSTIGENCHLAPSSVLCGDVSIGNDVHVGPNSVIINNVKIKRNTMIKAGSVITKNI